MILLYLYYFLQETPHTYTMSNQESISDLDWNMRRSLVDAGHVSYPLALGRLDRPSSCETMGVNRFDGHAPPEGDTMFPLQFHQPSNILRIESADSAQGPSTRSRIPYCELKDHTPARVDTGISSVDTEFFGTDAISNGNRSYHSTESKLGQGPRYRVVNLKPLVYGPLADITFLFFIEWQEYLPGGLSL